MKKRNTGKKIAKYVVIAIILFVLLFPVYWMINCSLLPSNVIMSVPPRFFPINACLLYTSPSPRDLSTSRMQSSA